MAPPNLLQTTKWWISISGWIIVLASWFQIIVVAGLGGEEISSYQWKFYVFIFLWIIITCSYFNAEYHCFLLHVNYCESCQVLKPLRAHHCKTCGRCVLRMDHHCPLLQVCIHHHNHKFFLLFLASANCLAIYVTFITIPNTIRTVNKFWIGETLSIEEDLLFGAVLNAVVILMSMGPFLQTQMQNLFMNRTTIEDFHFNLINEDEMNHEFPIFDFGTRMENFCSIFGKSPVKWFLPVFTTPGDGVNYYYVVRFGKEMKNPAKLQRRKRFYIC